MMNRVKLWREPALDNAEFLRATYRDHRFPSHAHDEYALGFIERGAQAFCRGRHEHLVMPEGKLCVINPGQFHEGRPATDAGWDYRMIYVSPSALLLALDGTDPSSRHALPVFLDTVIDDHDTLMAFHAAHLCSESPDVSQLEKGSRLVAALRQLSKRHGNHPHLDSAVRAVPRAVKNARELIDAQVAGNPSLAEIADAAGLSQFHLLRVFKATVGVPPHAYLLQRRIDRARRLLLQGQSLRMVAIEMGYCDQAHLTREFRRFHGIPPTALGSR